MNSNLQVGQTPVRILLVEDHIDTLMALARYLGMDGYHVHTADGYQAAWDVAKKQRIDLVVSDIALWDGDGCDLLRELRKLQEFKAIAVTGYTLADEVERCKDAGFAAVLTKPLELLQVRSVISQLTSAQNQ